MLKYKQGLNSFLALLLITITILLAYYRDKLPANVFVAFLFISFFVILFPIATNPFRYPTQALLYFLIGIFITITCFGIIYQTLGIEDSKEVIIKDRDTCLYFSIITFSTLGYGDFRPTEESRMYAAIESIFGYLYLGLFIVILSSYIIKYTKMLENDS